MAVVVHDVSSIRWFEEIGIEDIPLVGGKNASLGEIYRELASQGVKVPNGRGGAARPC
jgi:pyruvate,water dikinase